MSQRLSPSSRAQYKPTTLLKSVRTLPYLSRLFADGVEIFVVRVHAVASSVLGNEVPY